MLQRATIGVFSVSLIGLAVFAACGESSESNATGPGGSAGTLGHTADSALNDSARGGTQAGSDAAHADARDARDARGPIPEGALEFGPYTASGGISGQVTRSYMQSFGTGGYKWITYRGTHALGDPAAFVTGLIRLPADTPLGDGWICPGADSVYVATGTLEMSDCTNVSNRCEFALIMPNPTRLSCPTTGNGSLNVPLTVPQTGNSFTLQSSNSELAGPAYVYAGHTGVTLDPARTFDPTFAFLFQAGLAVNKNILLLFGATPVTPPAGQPVTSWSLSDVPILYRSNFDAETQIHCAKAGSYAISSTEPIAHGIELTGVSDVARCPGQPVGQPVVVRFQ